MPGGTPHAQLSLGCGLQRCGRIQTRCLSEVPKPAGFSSKTKARHCCRGNRHKSNAGASVTRRKSGTDVGLVNIHLFSCSEKCQVQEVLLPASSLLLRCPSEVSMPPWLQHTGKPRSLLGLSAPGRSHTLPTADPQTFAHVAVTSRPRHNCTGITESREIIWLGQAWLSATQVSRAAYQGIYGGLPTTRAGSF